MKLLSCHELACLNVLTFKTCMEKVRADVLDSRAEALIASFVTTCFYTGRHKVVVLGRL
jgi:hypothetical protein